MPEISSYAFNIPIFFMLTFNKINSSVNYAKLEPCFSLENFENYLKALKHTCVVKQLA